MYSNNVLRTVYFDVLFDSIRKNGLIWVFKKISYRCLKELIWLALLPISVCLHIVGIRRLLVRVEHIGHLAAEPDCYIKETQLKLVKNTRMIYFVLAPDHLVSNKHMLSYWSKHIKIITNKSTCSFLMFLTYRYFMRCDVSRYISSFFGTQDIYRINRLWGDRKPLLQLSDGDNEWSEAQFQQLGMSPSKKFVCVHVREGGYLPHNVLIQSHRNASIMNMMPSIEELIKRGYMVVRMGDSTMSRLPEMNGLIDYAHHPLKSERLDVVLCAKAAFFLGCTSGLSFVSMVFGVPVAQANMIPVEALAVSRHDLSIPKLLWDEKELRYLRFDEILLSRKGGFYFTNQYKDAHIRPDENSVDDLYMLTCEMVDRIEGKFVESSDDLRLHENYMNLFKPGHYSYGSYSRVCVGFLKKHIDLMPK